MALVPVAEAEHRIVHRDPYAYSAHPHAVALPNGEWLCVFNKSVRRPVVLHPPQDPFFCNFVVRSADRGRTWSAPVIVPDFGWQGMECAGLTPLADGRVLLNQWRFRWHPLPAARQMADAARLTFPEELARGVRLSPDLAGAPDGEPETWMPWARDGGAAFVHVSDDGGRVWRRTVELDTAPFEGGYGMRGAVELPDGRLVLPLSDVPAYERVFVLFSDDRGASWSGPVLAAAAPGKAFEEPCALLLPDGRLLMLLRENRSRHLHRVVSDDGGTTWSAPVDTGIDGYPAHLLRLADGRVLCTYGFRRPDYSIRAVLSEDGGRSWDLERTLPIRGGLKDRDLGYPCTVPAGDGELCTIYYCRDEQGVTSIWSTRSRPGI